MHCKYVKVTKEEQVDEKKKSDNYRTSQLCKLMVKNICPAILLRKKYTTDFLVKICTAIIYL